jgi:transglutaminase/protease-like cytokinesis protein 3
VTYRRSLVVIITFLHCFCHAQHVDFINVDFSKADSVAGLYLNNDLKHPDKLAEALTKDLSSEVDKFRAIFYWITENVAYDVKLYEKIQDKEWKLKYKGKRLKAVRGKLWKRSYARTIRKKIAICSGYAMLLEYMCNHVGITCNSINGYARNSTDRVKNGKANHAWNAVRLNNKWYLCDATWASGYYDETRNRFVKRWNNNYFLPDPSLLIANHFPNDTSWILLFNKPTRQEFLAAPIKCDGYFTNKVNTYFPDKGIVKLKLGEKMNILFTSNNNRIQNNAHLHIRKSSKDEEDFSMVLKQNNEGQYIIEHVFLRKGVFDVYVYINSDVTFIYKVVII